MHLTHRILLVLVPAALLALSFALSGCGKRDPEVTVAPSGKVEPVAPVQPKEKPVIETPIAKVEPKPKKVEFWTEQVIVRQYVGREDQPVSEKAFLNPHQNVNAAREVDRTGRLHIFFSHNQSPAPRSVPLRGTEITDKDGVVYVVKEHNGSSGGGIYRADPEGPDGMVRGYGYDCIVEKKPK